MHDTELEGGLDRDPAHARAVTGAGFAAGILQDPPDARDQPLQGRAIEAVGAAEVVHHPGLDVAL